MKEIYLQREDTRKNFTNRDTRVLKHYRATHLTEKENQELLKQESIDRYWANIKKLELETKKSESK